METPGTDRRETRFGRLPGVLLFAAALTYAGVAVRAAWCSDDSYITLRAIDHFIHGYGLRWNVAERVQTYTHPLWMLLMAGLYAITREHFLTLLGLSVGVSCGAVGLAGWSIARNRVLAIAGLTTLALSSSFIDFSTSGLENPLTHLLLACFVLVYVREPWTDRGILGLSSVAFLSAFNRLDTLLLFLPALLYAVFQVRTARACAFLALGALPLAGWLVFSVVYYGFPFPNTAYAKLGAGIPAGALWTQGLCYGLYTLQRDPLAAFTIVTGIGVAFARRPFRLAPLAIGALAYLAYVFRIGGDFMGGRFFTAPLFLCVLILMRCDVLERSKRAGAWILAVLLVGMAGPALWSAVGLDFTGPSDASGLCHEIMDEREYYRKYSSLEHWWNDRSTPDPEKANVARARSGASFAETARSVGFHGFFSGPDVYIIDRFGLCDPLLARLPAQDRANWRIGHFERRVPEGYLETRASGKMQIRDPDVARRCEAIDCITRGPIFSWERWKNILRMNWSG